MGRRRLRLASDYQRSTATNGNRGTVIRRTSGIHTLDIYTGSLLVYKTIASLRFAPSHTTISHASLPITHHTYIHPYILPTMCRKSTCETCRTYPLPQSHRTHTDTPLDKVTWWGCGNHIAGVMDNVPQNEWYICLSCIQKTFAEKNAVGALVSPKSRGQAASTLRRG